MTYCCGILVKEGLVMIADTRTNAGLDNVSTFRKLHVFSKPGDRIMAIASAGNLSISQSVLSTLTEGLEDPVTGEIGDDGVEALMNLGGVEHDEVVENSRKRRHRGNGRFLVQRGRGRIVVVIEPQRAALLLRGGGIR